MWHYNLPNYQAAHQFGKEQNLNLISSQYYFKLIPSVVQRKECVL